MGERWPVRLYKAHNSDEADLSSSLSSTTNLRSTQKISEMPPRLQQINSTSPLSTAHSLAILAEYTHELDTLPLDLSRNFADLRELDAVLSSSMTSLTSKVTQLTNMIETATGSKEQRLWLLADIAEEAGRLKPGADDKIRVACHAADGLRGHKTYMTTLLDNIPDMEFGKMAGMLGRKTVYPHVATRSYMPAGMGGEGGRRQRRGAVGTWMANSQGDGTPNKRRKVGKDDDPDAITKSPRKDRNGENQRQRNNARARKYVPSLILTSPMAIEFLAGFTDQNVPPHPQNPFCQWRHTSHKAPVINNTFPLNHGYRVLHGSIVQIQFQKGRADKVPSMGMPTPINHPVETSC